MPSEARAPLHAVFLDHTTAPGGAELALARTLGHLGAGWAATVLTPPGPDGVFAGYDRVAVGVPQRSGAATARRAGRLGHVRAALAHAVALRRDAHLRSCDVVVANTSRAAVHGALATWGTGIPLVVHLRDEVSEAALGRLGAAALRHALRRASLVVANSRHTLRSAEAVLAPGAVTAVLPSPVGMAVRAPEGPVPGPVRRVGMVARLDPWKGHELLLDAFAAAFPTGPVELHLAGGALFGEDAHRRRLEGLAADLGIASRVVLRGHVTDVASFVDDLDICVQCSTRPEPLGQNVLQYLARRRPTVVADAGGPAESVTDGVNGLIVPTGDVVALTGALRRLADDAELRRRLTAAPVRLVDDAAIGARLAGLLTAVVAAPSRAAGAAAPVAAPVLAGPAGGGAP